MAFVCIADGKHKEPDETADFPRRSSKVSPLYPSKTTGVTHATKALKCTRV